ncbi:MAG TPA: hypothetical protein VGI39_00155 [Polyangiaceae bacterium]
MSFASLLEQWAARYEVTTVLERGLGPSVRPACASFAARGNAIFAVVDDGSSAEAVRAAYGPKAKVHLQGDEGELPKSDLVVIHGDHPGGDWRHELAAFGSHASKLVVVSVPNAGAWQAQARRLLARARGEEVPREDGWGRTEALAPVLWSIGRVREHAYVDVPSVGDRAPKLVHRVAGGHVFLVDVTPRTPQARRKIRLQTV